MSRSALKYPALRVCEELRKKIAENLDRYLQGDFEDYADTDDWAIPLNLQVDLAPLKLLETNPAGDAENSLLVWQALGELNPSLASEGRIWTRLSHVEGLAYARERWIGGRTGAEAVQVIDGHFFADTRTACRDDNAIGRLWWTAFVAKRAMPDDHEAAVRAIWKTADIRSNVIERPWISSRPRLASAIVRAIITIPDVTASESAFRDFMKAINRLGGGLMFEVMEEPKIDAFIASCVPKEPHPH